MQKRKEKKNIDAIIEKKLQNRKILRILRLFPLLMSEWIVFEEINEKLKKKTIFSRNFQKYAYKYLQKCYIVIFTRSIFGLSLFEDLTFQTQDKQKNIIFLFLYF